MIFLEEMKVLSRGLVKLIKIPLVGEKMYAPCPKQAESQSCAIASHVIVLPHGVHFKRNSHLRKENVRWKYSDSQWKWVCGDSLAVEGLSRIVGGCKEAVPCAGEDLCH